jgi:hypothetical protein
VLVRPTTKAVVRPSLSSLVATGRCGRPANLELLSPVLASGRRRRKEPPDPAPPRPDPVVAQLWKMVAVALAGVCGAGGGGGRRSDFDSA